MTVQDVVKLSATYLDKEDVLNYLEKEQEGSPAEVNTLTVCANVVINELACSYLPMIKTEKLIAEDNKLYFTALSETPLKIISVTDYNGNAVRYDFHAEYLSVDSKKVVIEYKYIPSNLGLTDRIDYDEREVPLRLLAFGTISEYALIERDFDKSLAWRNRYNDLLSQILSPKNIKTKARKFI